MGNEQAAVGSPNVRGQRNEPPGSSAQIHEKARTEHEILIVVRGLRRTGKSTLVKRMCGESFNETYVATSMLAATEIPWTSPKGESVNVTCWDVVERALLPVDATERVDAADATTIDTLKRADGLVVMIDSRFKDTVILAEKIISSAQDNLPILVFNNFMDQEDSCPVLPELLQQHMGKMFFYIPGSLKTNQGLVEVSNWLAAPLLMSKKKMHYNIFRALESDLLTTNAEFAATSSNFIDLESAKKNMPKFIPIPHQNPQEAPQQAAIPAEIQPETPTPVPEEPIFVAPVKQQQHSEEAPQGRPHRKSYEKPYKRRQQRTTTKPKVVTSTPEPEPVPATSEDPFGGQDEEEAPKKVVRRRSRGSSRVKVSPKEERQSVNEKKEPEERKEIPEPIVAPKPEIVTEKEEKIEDEGAFWSDGDTTPKIVQPATQIEAKKEEEPEDDAGFWSDDADEAETKPVQQKEEEPATPKKEEQELKPATPKKEEEPEDDAGFWSDDADEAETNPVQQKEEEPATPKKEERKDEGEFWSDEPEPKQGQQKKEEEPEDDGGFWSDDGDEPEPEPEPIVDDDDDDEILRPNPLVQMQVKSVDLRAAIKSQVEENEEQKKEVYAPMPELETGYENMNEPSEDEAPAHADDGYGEMEGTDSPVISAPQKKTVKKKQRFQRRKA